jgi:hypothetical protein
MVNLMELVRDVARSQGIQFVDRARRAAADRAFAAGVACILKCQVKVEGELTIWCAQHDEVSLEPRGARTYELPSLSGMESAGILILLMSLEKPSPEVVRAVEAGVRWFEDSKLTGIRQVVRDGDKRIVPDRGAPPLWARFYEIETNRPFFCGRDGVKKDNLAAIEAERRNGYAWYGEWGRRVLERYGRWEDESSRLKLDHPIPNMTAPALVTFAHEIGKGRFVHHIGNRLADARPEGIEMTAAGEFADFGASLAYTVDRRDRAVDVPHHLTDGQLIGRTRQAVAALSPAPALHKTAPFELVEDHFQKPDRYLLPFRNLRNLQWLRPRVIRQCINSP